MSAWNPSDKSTNITLSSTNHVAACATFSDEGVRALISHTTGKFYLEMAVGGTGGIRFFTGFSLLADTLTTGTPNGFYADINGFLHANGTSYGSFVPPAGHTIGFAVDLGSLLGWARLDGGAWIGDVGGSPDPVAGVLGVPLTHFSGAAMFPACHLLYSSGAACNVTLNLGDTSFATAAPSGFSAWDNTPPPNTKRSFSTLIN